METHEEYKAKILKKIREGQPLEHEEANFMECHMSQEMIEAAFQDAKTYHD